MVTQCRPSNHNDKITNDSNKKTRMVDCRTAALPPPVSGLLVEVIDSVSSVLQNPFCLV